MAISTDDILSSYLETGSYSKTAKELRMKPDAVRKRIRRSIPPGSSTLFKINKDGERTESLQWHREPKIGSTADEMAQAVLDTLKDFKPPAPLKTPQKAFKDLGAFVPLVDLHSGLLVWSKETGKDWDIKIAHKTIIEAYQKLFASMPDVQKIFLVGVGDLLHADNYSAQTGTPNTSHILDVDGRYPKTFGAALDLCLSIGSMALRKAKQVEYKILPGNHDVQSSVGIAYGLHSYYRNQREMTVDLDWSPHWCARWGKTMLAASHGDKLRPDRMPLFFAAKFPEIWGETKWRQFFSGHLHQERLKEHPGCTAEVLGTPIPGDSYANAHGFLSSQHVHARVYDLNKGEELRPRVNIL